jgi:hypothetical protein
MCRVGFLGEAVLLFAVSIAIGQPAQGVDLLNDFNSHALADFRFERLPLAASVEQMRKRFPGATPRADEHDRELAREQFLVNKLETADSARFFFCDDKLYQMEIRYRAERLNAQGGIPAILARLVAAFGAADHAGEGRWTWQQPNVGRRADFYGTGDGGYLVVTDLNLLPVVEERTRRVETAPANFGF